jgi:hypothetical protein
MNAAMQVFLVATRGKKVDPLLLLLGIGLL